MHMPHSMWQMYDNMQTSLASQKITIAEKKLRFQIAKYKPQVLLQVSQKLPEKSPETAENLRNFAREIVEESE